MEQGTLRHHQVNGLEAAGVERNRLPHQATEDIEHHRLGDGQGGIEIAVVLGGGAAEIHPGPACRHIDLHGHPDLAAMVELNLGLIGIRGLAAA